MAASARIDELRSKFDDNPRRYFASLANEYRKAGDLETAIAICRTQLRHFPEHMSGHVVLGQALFESGELDAARVAFERAVELDPENLIALRHLGDAAMARHDVESARRWYRRVLDIDAGNDAIATQLLTLEAPPIRIVEPESAMRPVASEPSSAETPAPTPLEPPPEAAPAPERATGFVDFDPDELAWPAPAPQAVPTVTDEVPAFVEAMIPPAPAGATADDDARTVEQTDAADFDFVDGWASLDVADLSATVEVPVPTTAGIGRDRDGMGGDDDAPSDVPNDPVVGLDLPPADDAGLRELAHVADDWTIDTSAAAVADEASAAEVLAVESMTVEWLPAEPLPATASDVLEPTEAVEPIAAPPGASAETAGPPDVRPTDAETAPLDEVIASGAFVTETMAELCVQQGHDDEALAIYEQLVAQRPDDVRVAERLAAVRTRLGRSAPPSISDPAGEYLRALAARRPGDGHADVAPPAAAVQPPADDAEPRHEATDEPSAVSDLTLEYPTPEANVAIEPPAAPPEARDTWAASAWSGAFRPDAAPERPLLADLGARDAAPDLSFDRFFVGLEEEPEAPAPLDPAPYAQGAPEKEAAPAAPTGEAPATAAEENGDQDLAEFNAWLRGLRDA